METINQIVKALSRHLLQTVTHFVLNKHIFLLILKAMNTKEVFYILVILFSWTALETEVSYKIWFVMTEYAKTLSIHPSNHLQHLPFTPKPREGIENLRTKLLPLQLKKNKEKKNQSLSFQSHLTNL